VAKAGSLNAAPRAEKYQGDRLLVGLHAAAEETLCEPEDNEFRKTGGCSAQE
jgi:hypothetical protein